MLSWLTTTPRGLDDLLHAEISQLGATHITTSGAALQWQGSLQVGYRVGLWSRLANRVVLVLQSATIVSQDATDAAVELYNAARSIAWHEHMLPSHTIRVDVHGHAGAWLAHSRFAGLKVKDAIADYFRDRTGTRPNVDIEAPDICVHVQLHNNNICIGIDLFGTSLHKRGYRIQGGAAPLKENLAAAVLLRSGFDKHDGAFLPVIDPMCGSATLLIEAAMIASNTAPGLLRYMPQTHLQYDTAVYEKLRDEALQRQQIGLKNIPPLFGFDADINTIIAAHTNIEAANVVDNIQIAHQDIDNLRKPSHLDTGHIIVNPPYGERLTGYGEDAAALEVLYTRLGAVLKTHFAGWQVHMLTHNDDLAKHTKLSAHKKHSLFNGAIPCKLWHMHIYAQDSHVVDAGYVMIKNRLQKNLAKLKRWISKAHITCYRLYDADLPEYAAAIDVYDNFARIQEYAAPKEIDPRRAQHRLNMLQRAVQEVLALPQDHVITKIRKRQRGAEQYEKQDDAHNDFFQVKEQGCTYWVNMHDYIDTGLFLDHRPLRDIIQQSAHDKHFLNLFGYTGSASVCAAVGGAASTTTIDMSATYINWAKRNMQLNMHNIASPEHHYIQDDCLQWLQKNTHACRHVYDMILLDPPTFSNSKRMQQILDIQRDYVKLIHDTMQLLQPDGVLYFSTNDRKFYFDTELLKQHKNYYIEDISKQSIPVDFCRNPRVHQCFRIGYA